MQHLRVVGAYLLAFGLFIGVAAPALAGGSDVGTVPAQMTTVGKDGGAAPAAMVPAGTAPAGSAPATVAMAPARAGGLDPAVAAAVLSGLGLLATGGSLAIRRRMA